VFVLCIKNAVIQELTCHIPKANEFPVSRDRTNASFEDLRKNIHQELSEATGFMSRLVN